MTKIHGYLERGLVNGPFEALSARAQAAATSKARLLIYIPGVTYEVTGPFHRLA